MAKFVKAEVVCLCIVLFLEFSLAVSVLSNKKEKLLSVLYLPLDERFTTRDAWLNLVLQTPYRVLTPPTTLLPCLRQFPNITRLHQWVDENIVYADVAVISLELYVYGGLIGSRISNDSLSVVQQRLDRLLSYKTKNLNLTLYVSSVVMRIPESNSNFEDAWYWDPYGVDLFTYSYYLSKYNALGNKEDLARANAAKEKVPPAIVSDFVWRRQRNHQISINLLQRMVNSTNKLLVERLYITLDDNAQYGFNIDEANELKQLVKQYRLNNTYIYPGADEVGLVMLSAASVEFASELRQTTKRPTFYLAFRDPNTTNYIPNFEGQPMINTIQDQIIAAGAVVSNGTADQADIILLVNNFSEKTQIDAPNQPTNGSINEFDCFEPYLVQYLRKKTIGLADVRYSNGADIFFVKWMSYEQQKTGLDLLSVAYAGWNTDGNTLGTVIANSVLLEIFNNGKQSEFFNALRLLEDYNYQALLRQELINYVSQVEGDSINNLATDLTFYKRFVYKILSSDLDYWAGVFHFDIKLNEAYFPWNRTFEIGFIASQN